MRLNRRQLRRLIESAIYEQSESGKKKVAPKEVRAELNNLRLDGITCLAFDREGNQGLAVRITHSTDIDGSKSKLAISRLKKVYGEDRVSQGVVKRLQGGSAGIKTFDGERHNFEKSGFAENLLTNKKAIFIKMD